MKRRAASIVLVACLAAMAGGSDLPRPAKKGVPQAALDSPALNAARTALFEQSQLDAARQSARAALAERSDDVEALFIEMEAAALEADTAAELEAALRLCELRGPAQRDPRVSIAGARIANLAANTEDFRAAVPRIRALLQIGPRAQGQRPHPQSNYLRAALLSAAMDGTPGLVAQQIARESGFILDWRVAGPFGRYANLDFDRSWAPERDSLAHSTSGDRPVERFHFEDGDFRLPEYFSTAGVLYAVSATATSFPGLWTVRAESAGTLEVFVDGVSVLRKDDRFRASPQIAAHAVALSSGAHHILVKFLASAASFRIALLPPETSASTPAPKPIEYAPEAAYVAAAQKYWRGDFSGAIRGLGVDQGRSASADFLLFQAWTHASDASSEASALLNATLAAAPAALAAEYELASRACAAGRSEECLGHLEHVLDARPRCAAANELLAQLAIRMHWNAHATAALEMQLRVHPSCESLRQAYKFFSRHARYARARDVEKQIESCAPDTLAFLETLRDSGRHQEAARAAELAIQRRPLDRSLGESLVRELALSGQPQKAWAAARDLAGIAPNSALYRRLARAGELNADALLDDDSTRTRDFTGLEPFFAPYRRDGVRLVHQTNERKFSGGPAVFLVDDRIVRVWQEGGISLYRHQLTRVIDRDGIERYGEVELPRGAEVLELRTIKADGGFAEPELNSRKATISMPALSPGDAIDVEYVIHYSGGPAEHPDGLRHTFGSFRAPILFSRFIVVTPAGDGCRAEVTGDIGPAHVEVAHGAEVRMWEKNDIAQSVEEVAIAHGDILPAVKLEPDAGGREDIRDRNRDALVDATRIGAHVEQAAARLRSGDPEAKAREIYRLVVRNTRSSQKSFAPGKVTSAEDTLATGAGSRSMAMLAIAHAAGLDADLVLSRPAGTILGANNATQEMYARPLVMFHCGGRGMVVDAETDGLTFGALPPTVEKRDAFLVASIGQPQLAAGPLFLSLNPNDAAEQSTADAEITLDEEGGLNARVTIVLGAWRAAQMRTILAGVEPAQRANFYQQLALRIFQRADDVTGETRNERDTDRPLQILLQCHAQRFVNLSQQANEMDQLVPALGLKKMYIGAAARKFPLFVDTPLVERAVFRVHLPTPVALIAPGADTTLKTDFGTYSLAIRQRSPKVIEIERSFRIPVQIVSVQRFPEFARFAARIDDAERQRITLARTPVGAD